MGLSYVTAEITRYSVLDIMSAKLPLSPPPNVEGMALALEYSLLELLGTEAYDGFPLMMVRSKCGKFKPVVVPFVVVNAIYNDWLLCVRCRW
jgi:hypothetical protein